MPQSSKYSNSLIKTLAILKTSGFTFCNWTSGRLITETHRLHIKVGKDEEEEEEEEFQRIMNDYMLLVPHFQVYHYIKQLKTATNTNGILLL